MKQVKHLRRSKRGKVFKAGKGMPNIKDPETMRRGFIEYNKMRDQIFRTVPGPFTMQSNIDAKKKLITIKVIGAPLKDRPGCRPVMNLTKKFKSFGSAGSLFSFGSKKPKRVVVASKKFPTGTATIYDEGGIRFVKFSQNISLKDQMQARKELKAAGWPI